MNIQKIEDTEVRSRWVQKLPDAPNRGGRYGTPGLTAAEVKAAYDALALCIIEHYNTLVEAIGNGRLSEDIPAIGDKPLSEVLSDIGNGNFSAYLTVDGLRSLSALAMDFDCHSHDERYAPLAGSVSRPFTVGEPQGNDDAIPRYFADTRYFSGLELFFDKESGLLSLLGHRESFPLMAETYLPTAQELLTSTNLRLSSLEQALVNLRRSAEGTTFESIVLRGVGQEYTFPEGTLPYVQLQKIGGHSSISPDGELIHEAPTGYTVLSEDGRILQNQSGTLAFLSSLFPDIGIGISPDLCNYYDFEDGRYHRKVKCETFPTPSLGTETAFAAPQLYKETAGFYVFNIVLGGRKPSLPMTGEPTVFCNRYFTPSSAAGILGDSRPIPMIALYGERTGFRCLKVRIPKSNDEGITADPATLSAFLATDTFTLLLPYEEELEEIGEQAASLPSGLIELEGEGSICFDTPINGICYTLEYDKRIGGTEG